ncbi:MAG: hypothetical protein PHQ43_03615 [Dehalococcoidales bacterium]|nr:hypothetical protein [Dehalococcoidales bacterium]
MADKLTEIEQLIAEKEKQRGQRIADTPKAYDISRQAVYGEGSALPEMREDYNRKIQELYSHDKSLATRYANPESEMYMRDPYQRELAVSRRYEGTSGQLGDIWKNIMNTQDLYGSVIDRGMMMYKAGLEALDSEVSALERAWERQFERDKYQTQRSDQARAVEASTWANRFLNDLMTGTWQEYADTPEQAAQSLAEKYPEHGDSFWKALLGYRESAGSVGETEIKNAQQLRSEFLKQSGTFTEVRDGYNRVLSSNDTAAGDVSLLFGYMKVLDPGSVVREGEFATAENTAGVPERIRQMYNKAISGDRLSNKQRKAFREQTKNLFEAAQIQHQTTVEEYTRLAERIGVDPTLVIVDLEQAQKLAARPKLKAPDGKVYEYDGVSDPDYLEDLNRGYLPI